MTLAVRVGGQQHDERRDLLGRREAAGREAADAGDDVRSRRVGVDARGGAATVSATPCSPSHRSVPTGPGETALTWMPARPELLGERLGEVHQRGLGRPVVDRAAVGLEEGVDRRDVDDRARRPARPCGDERGACRPQRGEEVHLHRPLEVVVGGAEEPVEAQPHGAHVVDQHVDAAVLVDRALDQPRGPSGCGQVDRDRGHTLEALEAVRRARAGDHERALVGEPCVTASPMPLLAPVTTATLSVRARSMITA